MAVVALPRARPFAPRALLPTIGPAVIASVAYMDPGNFATNIQAGSAYGYGLLWVIVLANAAAMLYQALSAKLGIVTNRSLAELCREHFPRGPVIGMWIASEIAAMATDLAEFVGGALGFSLLFHLPLLYGMAATAVLTAVILAAEPAGMKKIELIVGTLVLTIGACYAIELFVVPPDWGALALHAVVPQFGGPGALALAAGIVGATIMPHAIFMHSGLTKDRSVAASEAERTRLVRGSNRDVILALSGAGLVNLAMVAMAAAAFHAGHSGVAEIQSAYVTMVPLLGAGAGLVFLIALTASGVSSSVVGTMAGQMIMQGFVGFRIPVWVRRLVTIVPAFAVVAAGVNVTNALVVSQIVLSLVLPLPMVALLVLSAKRSVMGAFAAGPLTVALAAGAACAVTVLNGVLLVQTFRGS